MLDLAPETESRVLEYAAAQGVSVDELIARTFPPRRSQPDEKALRLIQAIKGWQAEDVTQDDKELGLREQESSQLHGRLDEARQGAGMRLLFADEKSF